MSTIKIREQGPTATGFDAILQLPGGEYPITITDPFNTQAEQDLEWYFERWLVFPFLDTIKAREIAATIPSYGEQLFQQVFRQNLNAYAEYQQLRSNLSQLQIEIIGKTPAFQALHWEALRDPDLNRPLVVDCVIVRKSINPAPIPANVQPSAVINLLVVVARPDEEKDISYRTISRPLVEMIEDSRLQVNVELLRPGTFKALSQHLEEKGTGFYHVIHLDMHGTLLSYEQVEKPAPPERYPFKGRYGRGDLQPWTGLKAFLAFEGDSQGQVDLVEAAEITALLTGKGIPVCILDACKSGKQVAQPTEVGETSLGSQLMMAGMQIVVGMSYSVTVSASTLMMKQFYQQLFAQKSLTEALRLGRRELFNVKERQAYFNQLIPLEDWLLPVVYSHQPVQFNLRSFTPEEEEKYWESRARRYQFPLPEYGFVGRDLEILKIEKALLRHNILLLQGMGGTGKTTLLNYLREWWQTTSFAKDVFYFGYDQKAWTLTQILFDIGQQVYSRFEQAQFQAMNQQAQVPKLVAKLRAEAYIIILDNLESITGEQLAIQNTLPPAEQEQIKDFLGRLVGGKTKVVLGSRSREEWLQLKTFKHNIYELQGLDRAARSELAEKILERNVPAKKIPEIRQDGDFRKLMDLLAGYPLAMEVVLGNLSKQTPTEILAALQTADVNLDTGSEDKTKSIIKCVEYSHSNLSVAAQQLLLCLAPFSGFIFRGLIDNYIAELQKLEPFQDYQFEQFEAAIQEAINWGLLSPIDSALPGLKIQPVFPYFLQRKLATVELATREALPEGFKNYYLGLASTYQQLMESKDTQERQLGILLCKWEYENLYNALQICLAKQASVRIYFCLYQYFELIPDHPSNLKLAEMVCQRLESYPAEFIQGKLGYQIPFAIQRLGSCYLRAKQYQEARNTYEQTLNLLPQLGSEETQKQLWKASTYHQLGYVAEELREFAAAQDYYQQALAIQIEFGDRFSQAGTYHQLGIVAEQLREFAAAKDYYQQALAIFIEFGDRFSQAGTYHQLGIVAQQLREFAAAQDYYQQALAIKIEFGDRFSQASTYALLGFLAAESNYPEARANLQTALEIYIEYKDEYMAAITRQFLEVLPE